ncbi:hypothetical protein GUITHDRAFT_143541 [Guillardia theta CCMP2712]|uniref:FCP1 homology domain-containing protein n=1 Tax=Guillardia theta (strain CCMP2712) TaxID=905079 RepID=L1ISV8_GUITC|nr:hypothetical protein GUITHDRAFT_143541 [Guillardia theta CCMP2712]EKX39336.1 hypothetical protein GUITHDRAFT_143541 [Guillardia theta CCMP2712]|eukprot:XP_005826316.1 hypothetical protein GUITHDRAFT_143541 [Guillardia theta CCMP2712]
MLARLILIALMACAAEGYLLHDELSTKISRMKAGIARMDEFEMPVSKRIIKYKLKIAKSENDISELATFSFDSELSTRAKRSLSRDDNHAETLIVTQYFAAKQRTQTLLAELKREETLLEDLRKQISHDSLGEKSRERRREETADDGHSLVNSGQQGGLSQYIPKQFRKKESDLLPRVENAWGGPVPIDQHVQEQGKGEERAQDKLVQKPASSAYQVPMRTAESDWNPAEQKYEKSNEQDAKRSSVSPDKSMIKTLPAVNQISSPHRKQKASNPFKEKISLTDYASWSNHAKINLHKFWRATTNDQHKVNRAVKSEENSQEQYRFYYLACLLDPKFSHGKKSHEERSEHVKALSPPTEMERAVPTQGDKEQSKGEQRGEGGEEEGEAAVQVRVEVSSTLPCPSPGGGQFTRAEQRRSSGESSASQSARHDRKGGRKQQHLAKGLQFTGHGEYHQIEWPRINSTVLEEEEKGEEEMGGKPREKAGDGSRRKLELQPTARMTRSKQEGRGKGGEGRVNTSRITAGSAAERRREEEDEVEARRRERGEGKQRRGKEDKATSPPKSAREGGEKESLNFSSFAPPPAAAAMSPARDPSKSLQRILGKVVRTLIKPERMKSVQAANKPEDVGTELARPRGRESLVEEQGNLTANVSIDVSISTAENTSACFEIENKVKEKLVEDSSKVSSVSVANVTSACSAVERVLLESNTTVQQLADRNEDVLSEASRVQGDIERVLLQSRLLESLINSSAALPSNMTELSWLNLADNLAHLQQVNFGASEIVRAPQELPMEPSKLVDQGSDLEETCNLSSSLPTTPRGPGHSVKTEKRFFFFRRTAAIEAKSLNTSLRPKSIQAAVADGEEEVQNALRFRPAPLLHVSSPAEAQASFTEVRRRIENEKIREREQILEESRSKHKHGDVKRFDKQDINTRNQFLRSQDHSATAAPERVLSSVGIILHHADNGEVWIEDANKDPFLLHQSRYEQSEQTDEEAENGRKQSLSKNHSLARTTRVLGPLRSHSGYIGILLDLDHTTIYGQDGNDLSIAFQLNGLDFSALCKLYTHLLNPQVKDLLERIRKLGYMFEVALYTRRSHLLSYMSLLRRRVISLKWREDWHFGSSHCLIPSNISSAEEVLETYRGVALMPQVISWRSRIFT